jgi:uroporphyrinogen decarboxylase
MTKPLLNVLKNRKPERRPVWLMRQAGRYLPEYRAVRQKAGSFLSLCYNPQLACDVTLQPLRRFDLDAAILFSDILVVPQAMGLALDFREGEGPVLQTVRDQTGVATLKLRGPFLEFEKVCETVGLVRQGLGTNQALIGFCGAPWTVASYMIEGGSSDRTVARSIAIQSLPWFVDLIDRLVEVSVQYLLMQIAAGAEAIQIFDSWAGDLPAEQQKLFVDAPIARMVAMLKVQHPEIPVIVFARGVGMRHAEIQRAVSCEAVSVEQDVAIADVLASLPGQVAVQGNLDPAALMGSQEDLRSATEAVLQGMPMARHVFNLGHGIGQFTDPAQVAFMLDVIRDHDGR